MKIAMINGSPKKCKSSSGALINDLKTCFSSEIYIKNYEFTAPKVSDNTILELNDFDSLVFSFPLYVDGIPSHLLSVLCYMEEIGFKNKNIRVYCIVNSGFYEGLQNRIAINILKNWCNKVGLKWGLGIGIGGGGALASMEQCPLFKGPKKSLGKAFKELSDNIIKDAYAEDIFISVNLPRFAYKLAAEMGWKSKIKENGLTVKDLDRQL